MNGPAFPPRRMTKILEFFQELFRTLLAAAVLHDQYQAA
jgi:hypothetical protein